MVVDSPAVAVDMAKQTVFVVQSGWTCVLEFVEMMSRVDKRGLGFPVAVVVLTSMIVMLTPQVAHNTVERASLASVGFLPIEKKLLSILG